LRPPPPCRPSGDRTKPGSAIHWRTPTSFKVIGNGNSEAVDAHPGVTDRDMIVVAKPLKDGTLSNSANVLAMDANGDLVGTLRVEITASGQPLNFITISRGTKQIFWDCSNARVEVDVTNKPTPDAVTITSRAPDGSLVTRQYGPTKPAPGQPPTGEP
jgi:hypothetical protein